MRPSSCRNHQSDEEIESYEEGKKSLINGWEKELDELVAKVKGSSLTSSDRFEALKKLSVRIIAYL